MRESRLRQLVERRALARLDDRELTRAQSPANGGECEFNRLARITFTREVRQVNPAPARTRHTGEQFARSHVRKMSVPAGDALLQ